MIRVADYVVSPVTNVDEWPVLRARIIAAEILIVATPTWLGQQSSLCQRVLERMDAMLSETREDGRPIAYDRVAGVVRDRQRGRRTSHHRGRLTDVDRHRLQQPRPSLDVLERGPGPGEEVDLNSSDSRWSDTTGVTADQNLLDLNLSDGQGATWNGGLMIAVALRAPVLRSLI